MLIQSPSQVRIRCASSALDMNSIVDVAVWRRPSSRLMAYLMVIFGYGFSILCQYSRSWKYVPSIHVTSMSNICFDCQAEGATFRNLKSGVIAAHVNPDIPTAIVLPLLW